MTTATGMTSLEDRVRAALGTVRDPELDESITDLDFVASVTVGDVGTARTAGAAGTSWSSCGCRRTSARRTSPT